MLPHLNLGPEDAQSTPGASLRGRSSFLGDTRPVASDPESAPYAKGKGLYCMGAASAPGPAVRNLGWLEPYGNGAKTGNCNYDLA